MCDRRVWLDDNMRVRRKFRVLHRKRIFALSLCLLSLSSIALLSTGFAAWNVTGNVIFNGPVVDVGKVFSASNYVKLDSVVLKSYCADGFINDDGSLSFSDGYIQLNFVVVLEPPNVDPIASFFETGSIENNDYSVLIDLGVNLRSSGGFDQYLSDTYLGTHASYGRVNEEGQADLAFTNEGAFCSYVFDLTYAVLNDYYSASFFVRYSLDLSSAFSESNNVGFIDLLNDPKLIVRLTMEAATQ